MLTHSDIIQHFLDLGVYAVDAETGEVRRYKVKVGNKYVGMKWYDCEPRKVGSINPKGYYATTVFFQGKVRALLLHQIAAVSYFGPRPVGMQVNHKNGVKTDNRRENLEYVTAQANQLHACRVLGVRQGERHGKAKLSNTQARMMRAEYWAGQEDPAKRVTYDELGVKYGMGRSGICQVIKGNRYGRI